MAKQAIIIKEQGKAVASSYQTLQNGNIVFWHCRQKKYRAMSRLEFNKYFTVEGAQ